MKSRHGQGSRDGQGNRLRVGRAGNLVLGADIAAFRRVPIAFASRGTAATIIRRLRGIVTEPAPVASVALGDVLQVLGVTEQ
jgi:hypothetical protein